MAHDLFKGESIRFVGGKYDGEKGWMDKRFESTPLMYPVIVAPCKKTKNKEKATKVYQENVGRQQDYQEPTNFVEAMLSQHEDIDRLLEKLCKEIAKCDIRMEKHSKHLNDSFFKRLLKAQGRQRSRGHKARWRYVNWNK
jgi:hypothetical protein